jgi:hypothetical protein
MGIGWSSKVEVQLKPPIPSGAERARPIGIEDSSSQVVAGVPRGIGIIERAIYVGRHISRAVDAKDRQFGHKQEAVNCITCACSIRSCSDYMWS